MYILTQETTQWWEIITYSDLWSEPWRPVMVILKSSQVFAAEGTDSRRNQLRGFDYSLLENIGASRCYRPSWVLLKLLSLERACCSVSLSLRTKLSSYMNRGGNTQEAWESFHCPTTLCPFLNIVFVTYTGDMCLFIIEYGRVGCWIEWPKIFK